MGDKTKDTLKVLALAIAVALMTALAGCVAGMFSADRLVKVDKPAELLSPLEKSRIPLRDARRDLQREVESVTEYANRIEEGEQFAASIRSLQETLTTEVATALGGIPGWGPLAGLGAVLVLGSGFGIRRPGDVPASEVEKRVNAAWDEARRQTLEDAEKGKALASA